MKKIVGRQLAKIGLKAPFLKGYFFVLHACAAAKRKYRFLLIPFLIKQRSRHGIYAINLDSDWIGLGARIVKILEILKYCEENNYLPAFQFGYQEKDDKNNNYFSDLFCIKQPYSSINNLRFTRIRDIDELNWKEDYNTKLRLSDANCLFFKYLSFNQSIESEVAEFWQQHFKDKRVLGVHYRGTDKIGEAPRLEKEVLLAHIKNLLVSNEFDLVFVSTDEQAILEFILTADLRLPVVFRKDHFRSLDGDQFHRKAQNSKYTVNRDAIVNMLLLSKCDFLLKTASILSDCSVIFNPLIPVQLLNQPYSASLTWWPAREIIHGDPKSRITAKLNTQCSY